LTIVLNSCAEKHFLALKETLIYKNQAAIQQDLFYWLFLMSYI